MNDADRIFSLEDWIEHAKVGEEFIFKSYNASAECLWEVNDGQFAMRDIIRHCERVMVVGEPLLSAHKYLKVAIPVVVSNDCSKVWIVRFHSEYDPQKCLEKIEFKNGQFE